MNSAIVTGANGFIGTALCKKLASKGIKVFAIIKDRKEYIGIFNNINNIQIIYCDLYDIDLLTKKIFERDIDVFYHFAWTGSAGELRSNVDIQLNNIKYSCKALEVAKELGCKKFVFASSIMEYEVSKKIEKDNSITIGDMYSYSKLITSRIIKSMLNTTLIEYNRAIISNVYGPGERSPRLINTTIRKLLNNEHCSFSEANQLYDFIYIDDAVEQFYLIGEKGENLKDYYIGNSKQRKLKDYLLEIKQIVNKNGSFGFGEVENSRYVLNYKEFDTKAIEDDMGYTPKVSFSKGILITKEYIENEKI